MNSETAKHILIGCRPGTEDMHTAEAKAALAQVQQDPQLQHWWDRQQTFQRQMQETFRHAPVPDGLRDDLQRAVKVIQLPWWRRPLAVGAAAAMVSVLISVAVLWLRPAPQNSFETFRSRMVRNVLRQYSMDIETNDMAHVRAFLASRNAPSDYVLPVGLSRLPLMGAGVLSWQDRRVSMVCLDSRTQGTLFLFVVDGKAVKNSPAQRSYATVSDLKTVSWSEGGKTYVLAGHGAKEWLEQHL